MKKLYLCVFVIVLIILIILAVVYCNKLKTEHDMAIILVSHDLDMVKKYADKVILLNKTIIKEGTPQEVFESKEYKEIF